MPHRTVQPPDAKQLLDGPEGWIYLDVRTPEEFQQGHAPGAYNAPIAVDGSGWDDASTRTSRKSSNDAFRRTPSSSSAARRAFAPSAPATCWRSSATSNLINMDGGFSGRRDQLGTLLVEGWQGCGFEAETDLRRRPHLRGSARDVNPRVSRNG